MLNIFEKLSLSKKIFSVSYIYFFNMFINQCTGGCEKQQIN